MTELQPTTPTVLETAHDEWDAKIQSEYARATRPDKPKTLFGGCVHLRAQVLEVYAANQLGFQHQIGAMPDAVAVGFLHGVFVWIRYPDTEPQIESATRASVSAVSSCGDRISIIKWGGWRARAPSGRAAPSRRPCTCAPAIKRDRR